jgi:hypothetical protein
MQPYVILDFNNHGIGLPICPSDGSPVEAQSLGDDHYMCIHHFRAGMAMGSVSRLK